MTNAFLYRMGEGFAGSVTRIEVAKIMPEIMDPDTPVTEYGLPVQLVSGKIQPLSSNSDVVYGFVARPYPAQEQVSNEALGEGTPSTEQLCDILKSGFICVKNTAGTAAKNGQVYYNNTTGKIQATSGSATAITGAFFQGEADTDGVVEICYNL